MRFSYVALPTKLPVASLGGAMVRYRPILPIRVVGPLGSRLLDGCVDCGADDTIFPLILARKIGVDLSNALQGEGRPVGGITVPYLYAQIKLQLTDGLELFEWQATVGFADIPLRWALLGLAGFLDFFDVELRGTRKEFTISTNPQFSGVIIPRVSLPRQPTTP